MPIENSVATAATWTVVLRPDGVVDDVQGGAPVTWLGRPLTDAPLLPEPVREELPRLSRPVRSSNRDGLVRSRRVATTMDGHPVQIELVLCDAIPLRRSHVRISDLIGRVAEIFRSQAKESNVALEVVEGPFETASVFADGEKVTWAISMLVANGIRHAASTPHAMVRLCATTEDGGENLVVRVEDNGPGLTGAQLRWLFERDPATGRAAGLALVMVKDVVTAHRGTIEVSSEAGAKTAFRICIPLRL